MALDARRVRRLLVPLLCALGIAPTRLPTEPRRDWIDPATGHRIIRLSSEAGSRTLYFHDNA